MELDQLPGWNARRVTSNSSQKELCTFTLACGDASRKRGGLQRKRNWNKTLRAKCWSKIQLMRITDGDRHMTAHALRVMSFFVPTSWFRTPLARNYNDSPTTHRIHTRQTDSKHDHTSKHDRALCDFTEPHGMF